MEKNTNEKNKPQKIKISGIHIDIWTNTGQNLKGENYEYKTICPTRVYKDKDGQWQNTASFRVADIPKVIVGLQKAYEQEIISEDKGEDSP